MSRIARLWLTTLFVIGCSVEHDDAVERSEDELPVVDALAAEEPTACTPGTDHWGCPGLPCAHGWCFVGECVGVIADDEGQTVDPGVCCVDDDCDAD